MGDEGGCKETSSFAVEKEFLPSLNSLSLFALAVESRGLYWNASTWELGFDDVKNPLSLKLGSAGREISFVDRATGGCMTISLIGLLTGVSTFVGLGCRRGDVLVGLLLGES